MIDMTMIVVSPVHQTEIAALGRQCNCQLQRPNRICRSGATGGRKNSGVFHEGLDVKTEDAKAYLEEIVAIDNMVLVSNAVLQVFDISNNQEICIFLYILQVSYIFNRKYKGIINDIAI